MLVGTKYSDNVENDVYFDIYIGIYVIALTVTEMYNKIDF